MQINNNLSAMFVNRQLQKSYVKLNKSIEKLSTGMRINRAGDDATNLAVSEKMRTQMRGLKQAERNAMNGLSFIQVAEGGMGQVNDIMQRIRELAVQSANGIYSQSDRVQIQVEVSQLIEEIDRISTTATFNRMEVLTGQFARSSKTGTIFFHVGPNQDQRIRAYVSTMNSRAFGLQDSATTKKSIATVGEANAVIGTVDNALDKLTRQRADLGAYYNRIETTVEALRTGLENMTAAESRIRDTDMAEELVEFTKNQVLLQSSTAMLAQANFSSRLVLQLLDGF
jgi:flagellin